MPHNAFVNYLDEELSSSVCATFLSYICKMSSKLDEIDDMRECLSIMQSFGLPTKGLKTLDEMKNKISDHLRHLEGSSTRKVGEVSPHSPYFIS